MVYLSYFDQILISKDVSTFEELLGKQEDVELLESDSLLELSDVSETV